MKGHQMLAKLRKDRENEEGFTLIELLVVVIIIGILAAIAIPAFLNQREGAWRSALLSDIRNAALEIETIATESGGNYPATFDFATVDTSPDVALQGYSANGTGTAFCFTGTHASLTGEAGYDSDDGGVQEFLAAGYTCTTGDIATP